MQDERNSLPINFSFDEDGCCLNSSSSSSGGSWGTRAAYRRRKTKIKSSF